jgi:hypothetical protein
MTRFIAEQEKLHSYLLGLQVNAGDWITDQTLRGLTAALSAKSSGVASAAGRAAQIVDSRVRQQAYVLTYIDGFHLVAWACVFALVLLVLMRRFPLGFGDLVAAVPNGSPRKDAS